MHPPREFEDPAPGFSRRNWALVTGILLAVCITGAGAYFVISGKKPAVLGANSHTPNADLAAARSAKADGRLSDAVAALQHILLEHPQDLDAVRLMAEIALDVQSPLAGNWLERACRTEGAGLSETLLYARYLGAQGEIVAAERLLDEAQKISPDQAEVLELRGDLALGVGDFRTARAQYQRAAEAAPSFGTLAVKAISVEFLDGDDQSKGQAKDSLAGFATQSDAVGIAACRILARSAAATGDRAEAARWARRIRENPTANFDDRLEGVNALRDCAAEDETFFALQDLRTHALQSDEGALRLLNWLNGVGLVTDALDFRFDLDDAKSRRMPFSLAIAETYVLARDRAGLLSWLNRTGWEGAETVPQFIRAHFARERGVSDEAAAGAITEVAASAAKTAGGTDLLISLASRWGWRWEKEKLLWYAAEEAPDPFPALLSLARHAMEVRDEAALHAVLLRAYQVAPDNPVVAHDLARIGLLNADPSRLADKIAAQGYAEDPSNPLLACTYALSLAELGKGVEAVAVIERLSPAAQTRQDVRLYHSIALAAAGDRNRALAKAEGLAQGRFLPVEWERLRRSLSGKPSPAAEAIR